MSRPLRAASSDKVRALRARVAVVAGLSAIERAAGERALKQRPGRAWPVCSSAFSKAEVQMREKLRPITAWSAISALCLTFACGAEPDDSIEPDPASVSSGNASADQPLAHAASRRGSLIEAVHLRTLSPAQVRQSLLEADFDASAVEHGVELHRLVYRTIDPAGQPIAASGLFALPDTQTRHLQVVSFTHGTEVYKGDAPSVSEDGWASGPSLTYASAGFAATAPDYLGLGTGPGEHPWMHLPTEVSAALDLLRAARTFALRRALLLERSVFVTGFSQGSFAALGLGRALERGADAWFRLAALAPISGPYRWSEWVRAAAAGETEPKGAMAYLAYLSVAWNRIYGLYEEPSEFFLPPYDSFIEDLFDNTHPGDELFERTPGSPAELFTSSALERLVSPDPQLARALAVLDGVCSGWSPQAPTRLFAASGDEYVPFAHSEDCRSRLRASGAKVSVVDLGDADHLTSNRLAAAQALRFFVQHAR
jgi:hypothetical protein